MIDGQQRLWSVWEFLNDEYVYESDGRRQHFSKMTAAQKQKIKTYEFQATVFEDADDDYLRELFVRLQIALLLNTGEKLHAAKGMMKRLVFDKLAKHPFIEQIGIPKRRYAKETLCAQICINSFTREKLNLYTRTRYEDLLHFFNQYADPKGRDLEFFNLQSRVIIEVMNHLRRFFGNKNKNLRNRSYILTIYLFVEELISQDRELTLGEQRLFSQFVFQLWKRLKEESRLGIDRENRELYSFQTLLSSAPGEAYQIERRHTKLGEYYEYFRKLGKIKGDK